jgi:predicted ATPase with chaperone activity
MDRRKAGEPSSAVRERVEQARARQPGQGERRESATDVRLDGDEMPADADDGDAGQFSGTYMVQWLQARKR